MKERWPEMLEYQQKVQAMTDLERARWLLPDGTDEVEVRELAEVIAAARREGAEAEREKVAMWMIERSIPTGHGDTVEDLLAELRAVVAEEAAEEWRGKPALPAEMPDWFVAWWSRHGDAGIFGHDAAMRRRAVAWVALRAHLLGQDV